MQKNDLFELRRQALHIFLGLGIVYGVSAQLLSGFGLLVIACFGLIISYLSRKHNIPVIAWFLNKFERPQERKSFPGKGIIFFIVGCTLAVAFFPRDIALASIMVLTLGDAIPPLLGRQFGKSRKINRIKVIIGIAVGSTAGFIGALVFVSFPQAAAGSLAAMILEAFELKYGKQSVDDNLVIPIVSAVVMMLV